MTTPEIPEAETDPDEDLARLDERLAWARADMAAQERLAQRIEGLRRQLARLTARARHMEQRVEQERRDVDVLETFSAVRLLASLFGGDLDERLAKERQEWVAAAMRHAAACEEHEEAKQELAGLEARLASMADARASYLALLDQKTAWLAQTPDPAHERLHLAEREGLLRDELRELDEALWAGDVARAALAGVLHALGKAQAVGRLDMIAMAPSWAKFHHVDDAHRHASSANRALSRFQMELDDVQERHEAEFAIEVGARAAFADTFFDDLVSDWVVQCRIVASRRSAAVARTRVSRTQRALRRRRFEVEAEWKALRARARELGRPEPRGDEPD